MYELHFILIQQFQQNYTDRKCYRKFNIC